MIKANIFAHLEMNLKTKINKHIAPISSMELIVHSLKQ